MSVHHWLRCSQHPRLYRNFRVFSDSRYIFRVFPKIISLLCWDRFGIQHFWTPLGRFLDCAGNMLGSSVHRLGVAFKFLGSVSPQSVTLVQHIMTTPLHACEARWRIFISHRPSVSSHQSSTISDPSLVTPHQSAGISGH